MANYGTTRTSILNRRAGQKARISFWLRRVGLSLFAILTLMAVIFYTLRTSWWAGMSHDMAQKIETTFQNHGFRVENLLIEGRVHCPRGEVKDAVHITRGDSILSLDLKAMQERLEQLSWVKSAKIVRHYPDTVYIGLTERTPIALWQRHNQLAVVDESGKILESRIIAPYRNLLLIVGDRAPLHVAELQSNLAPYPLIKSRVDSAKWVGNRRWDLYLSNGVSIKLPEDDVMSALERLENAQKNDHLIDRDITALDLRDPIRIVVETPPGGAEDYQASFKSQKGI